MPGRRQSYHTRHGFTLVELMVVVSIVGVLAAVAMDRLLFYTERAEKAAVDATLAAAKMGLRIKLAELIMTNRQMAATQLERENPMRWLAEPPSNYLGEYSAAPKPGNWYFATDSMQLVYRPGSTRYLQLNADDGKELRFQVRLYYEEIDTISGKARGLAGIGLVPVRPYRWF